MATITLTINGKEVKTSQGDRILDAAQEADIYIPTLCAHPDLHPYGGCRMCIVQVQNMRGLPPACSTPAADGMVVATDTPEIQALRRSIMEFILSEHPHPCLTCHRIERCDPFDICLRHVAVTERCVTCPKNKRCELQQVSDYVGIKEVRAVTVPYKYRGLPLDARDPFFDRDYNLCILCGRCVRVCQEVRGAAAIAFTYRGSQALVGTAFNRCLEDSGCQFCGACVDVCPTGALIERDHQFYNFPDRTVPTICAYCGVGCTLNLEVKDDRIIRVWPDPHGLANQGQACVKGKFGTLGFVHHPDRLRTPLIRRHGQLEPATWEEALSLVATRLAQYRGDSFAAIASAKSTNEENYVIQKFARAVMGTNDVDHCARLCHAPSVAGLAQTFGSGAMTNSIREVGDAACLFAIGTNTTASHPVVWLEMKRAINSGAKLIVANPREIALCRFAHIWLQLNPGSDVALLMGMCRIILDEGLADMAFIEERCENFDAFKESLKAFDLERVEQLTGVPQKQIVEAARLYATVKPASILYTMGVTQHTHGTDNVLAISNLALLTGNIGKPSSGVNPLRGQNNVQGACDMGALPNVYPGYQRVDDPAVRQKFETAWGCSLSPQPGLTLTEIFDAAYDGRIKAIYLVGENPMLSDPDAGHVEEALKRLEFLVVQDIFMSETAELAHVVLPATSFAEKDGTFTNTERRVQQVRQAIPPVGNSRPDWQITCDLARRLGAKGFDYSHPAEIMDEIARLTPSYGGISFQRLEKGGLQWPCPTSDHPGTVYLHKDRFVRGKGRFMPLEYRPPAEQSDADYPLVLTTERLLYHYHTGTMTRKIEGLNRLRPEELVEINPTDAEKLGVADGEVVRVVSRRGRVNARARVTTASPPGVISMSFHFTESRTNLLTNPALDPTSKIPELKVAAVRVEKSGLGEAYVSRSEERGPGA